MITIKEIAEQAGVSIATVSHVVNKTRYVAPELVEKVEAIIDSLEEKPAFVKRSLNKKKNAKSIVCVIDGFVEGVAMQIAEHVQSKASSEGYMVSLFVNIGLSAAKEIVGVEDVSGMIYFTNSPINEKIIRSIKFGTHCVIIGKNSVENAELNHSMVLIDCYDKVYRALEHLVRRGHEDICYLYGIGDDLSFNELTEVANDVLTEAGLVFRQDMLVPVQHGENENAFRGILRKIFENKQKPTAIICSNKELAISFLKYARRNSIKYPEDISLLCLSENDFNELISPGITAVCYDTKAIGEAAFDKLHHMIVENNIQESGKPTVIKSKIFIRESTQSIGRGPRGEKAANITTVALDEADIEKLNGSSFTAILAFHHSGTAWRNIHEKAIKEIFLAYGIKVLAVMDAHYDPEIQIRQLESIIAIKPDVLISVPTDEVKIAKAYKEVVKSGIKLVFINNVPANFGNDEYVSCISVNECENGRIAGEALGEYMLSNNKKSAGFIVHGADFFATKQRDMVAQQTLQEVFGIEIVDIKSFLVESNVYNIAMRMIMDNPQIEALYVSWNIPALEVMRALKELGREDIGIVTADLDLPLASSLVEGGVIKTITAQRLYKQGSVIAQAAGCALLNKPIPKYIGVNPLKVTQDNLLEAWQEVMGSSPPEELVSFFRN